MQSADTSGRSIVKLIVYGLRENNIDTREVSRAKVRGIIRKYLQYCRGFEESCVLGKLDTFKEASCLLIAINNSKLVKDCRINASVAYDAATKMCEKPYWNYGEDYASLIKLQ